MDRRRYALDGHASPPLPVSRDFPPMEASGNGNGKRFLLSRRLSFLPMPTKIPGGLGDSVPLPIIYRDNKSIIYRDHSHLMRPTSCGGATLTIAFVFAD